MTTSEEDVNRLHYDDSHVTAQQWKWTVLAGMASYLDAGSIVALAAGLALWQQYLGMSSTTVGLLAALGPNAFGAAIGALIGGRLGDLFGRKRIYQYDLLVYGLGTLLIVFSLNLPMLLIGTFIVGVAVGADVPTSLALIGEFSPSKARGRLVGLSQVAWSLSPIVVYVLAFALSSYGVLGNRIVFAHLFVVAIVTWALRRGIWWSPPFGPPPRVRARRRQRPTRMRSPRRLACRPIRSPRAVCAICFSGLPWRRWCSPRPYTCSGTWPRGPSGSSLPTSSRPSGHRARRPASPCRVPALSSH